METLLAILGCIAIFLIAARFIFQVMWLYSLFLYIAFVFGVYILIIKVAPLAIYKNDTMSISAILIFALFVFIGLYDLIASRKSKKVIEEWLTLQNRVIPSKHNGTYNLTSEDWVRFAEWKKLYNK